MSFQSLAQLNSFKLDIGAKAIVDITSLKVLQALLPIDKQVLVLGGGSNILFTQHFDGTILHNRLKGISITQDDEHYYLQVAGGENWHDLVMHCVAQGIGGLENLALIPGTVGAAPIQNIGAYGVEFSELCDEVEAYDLREGSLHRLSCDQCRFGYRDSLFKQQRHYFISHVRLKLAKRWQATLNYGELKEWANNLRRPPTPLQVAQQIIAIRQRKLPDPKVIPNVGSFFKNPYVSLAQAKQLMAEYPNMPQYPAMNKVKLAAGWLIDQLGLKGFAIGGAAVHQQQALVLINQGNATAKDVVLLAQSIREQVHARFNVTLEPEVNFVGMTEYSHLDEAIKHV